MSTVERTRPPKILPPLVDGQHLDQPTFHERYEAMPPETRAELVGGVVYMPSPVSCDHGEEDSDVGGWLFHYKRLHAWASAVRMTPRSSSIARESHNRTASSSIPAELGGQSPHR